MKGTYRCTNVKFCMEDEKQRRAWEYLHGLSRADGSYGKVLSEALIQVLDMEMESSDMRGKIPTENDLKISIQELAEETARIVLEGIKELSGEGYMLQSTAEVKQISEETEQVQDEDVSEDMLAFAFGMGE